jgi:hypothetical protein
MSEIVINIRIVIRKEVRLLYLKMLLELFRDNGMKNYAKKKKPLIYQFLEILVIEITFSFLTST